MSHDLHGPGDLTTRARIRQAAMQVIAERGSAGASVRAIAEVAQVSPALVLHHFTSKQAVFDEVARWALDALHTATEQAAATATPADAHERRQAAMDGLLDRLPHLGDYLRQLLLSPSPEGVRWFAEVVRTTATDLRGREEAGLARPSSDPQTVSAMLVLLSMAPVLLQPFLDAALDTDLASEEGRARWRRSQAELLTSALYPSADV